MAAIRWAATAKIVYDRDDDDGDNDDVDDDVDDGDVDENPCAEHGVGIISWSPGICRKNKIA